LCANARGAAALAGGLLLLLAAVAAAEAPILTELDAVKIEKAGLEVQLLQTRMELLTRSASLLQWEAAEIQRQLGMAVAVRDAAIRQAAERSKGDPKKCKPVVGASPSWTCD